MRIGIDVSSVVYGTGVSRYTSNLVRGLLELSSEDSFTLFASSFREMHAVREYLSTLEGNDTVRLWHLPPNMLAYLTQVGLVSVSSLVGKHDLFHAWDWYLPKARPHTTVMTVHDLALFKYPETAHPRIMNNHRHVIERGKTQDTHVIAVSEATKQDLIELFSYPEALIRVIPEALPIEHRIKVTMDRTRRTPARGVATSDKPYFLIVGTTEPRKNMQRMIEAWQHYKDDFDLYVAGKAGWDTIEAQEGIHLTGYVDSETMASLFANAEALLYCSLYEGFGLPILEAFYHEIPVVTSNVSSMPEVAGDAAIYADPTDVQSIVIGIQQAIDNRAGLVSKGKKRLADFLDWGKVAAQTLDFYHDIHSRQ